MIFRTKTYDVMIFRTKTYDDPINSIFVLIHMAWNEHDPRIKRLKEEDGQLCHRVETLYLSKEALREINKYLDEPGIMIDNHGYTVKLIEANVGNHVVLSDPGLLMYSQFKTLNLKEHFSK